MQKAIIKWQKTIGNNLSCRSAKSRRDGRLVATRRFGGHQEVPLGTKLRLIELQNVQVSDTTGVGVNYKSRVKTRNYCRRREAG